MKNICIIPARGGSKSIPGKNIMDFFGRPLIAWSIEQAISSRFIDQVYVTTDDQEIARISRNFGARIIERPISIAGDNASSESALLHALNEIRENEKYQPDYIMFLQVTSPLRKPDDIDNAFEMIITEDGDSLFSGAKFEDFLFWGLQNGTWKSINYDYLNRTNRQSRQSNFVENGSIYIFKPEVLCINNNRIGGKLSLYPMEMWQTWEIDNYDDLDLVKFYFERKIKPNVSDYFLNKYKLLVYDFDGVMTDNRLILNQDGFESVSVNRGDGLAIDLLGSNGFSQIIISTEKNPVVESRAKKLGIPVYYGVKNKLQALSDYCRGQEIALSDVLFIGNDINDLEVMLSVGLSVCPVDAAEEIKKISKVILPVKGGYGVIRELINHVKIK